MKPSRIARLNSGPPLTSRQLEDLICELEGAVSTLDIVSDRVDETARTDATSESSDVTLVVSDETYRAWRFATRIMVARVHVLSDAFHVASGLLA